MDNKFGESPPRFIEKANTCKECGGYAKPPFKLCFDCNSARPDPKQEQIQWGQSWNLAAQMVVHSSIVPSLKKKDIEDWQAWFYRKLQRKPAKVEGGKPSLLKKKYQTSASEKGMSDSIDDMGGEQIDFGGY